jgi:hypothetical protein
MGEIGDRHMVAAASIKDGRLFRWVSRRVQRDFVPLGWDGEFWKSLAKRQLVFMNNCGQGRGQRVMDCEEAVAVLRQPLFRRDS